MSQKNETKRLQDYHIIVEATASTDSKRLSVPSTKRKEDAKKTLYINRV